MDHVTSHFEGVRSALERQLSFGELDGALSQVDYLRQRCSQPGFDAAILDELAEAISEDLDAEVDVDVIDDDSGPAQALQAEVLSIAGDYFALFRRDELAETHYRAAVGVNPKSVPAKLGLSRCLASKLVSGSVTPETAMEAAMDCLRLLLEGAPSSLDPPIDAEWERLTCESVWLVDNVLDLSGGAAGEHCQLQETTEKSLTLLRTSAGGGLASLARRWLVPPPGLPLPFEDCDDGGAFPHCLRELLTQSDVFCHARLERRAAEWRARLAGRLFAAALDGGAVQVVDMEDAAALACHMIFVGFCVPPASEAQEAKQLQRGQEALRHEGSLTLTASQRLAVWVLVALYEKPVAGTGTDGGTDTDFGSDIERASEELMRAGSGSGSDHTEDLSCVKELFARVIRQPLEELRLVEGIEVLATAVETPCREFYNETIYPPWHDAVCAAGVVPLPIMERLRRQYSWINEDTCRIRQEARVLIAGCGSGHQIAVELRTYSHCTFVALDCSQRTLAYARRKLQALLPPQDFARVRFAVGDIMSLLPGCDLVAEGFDLIICCGVLHHLREPAEGLRRLTGVLRPGGVLQMATYSRISVESWRPAVTAFLRAATWSSMLYGPQGHLRTPTPQEVCRIRGEILSRPPECEVRKLLVHFKEFFSYGGFVDLLFHPQEHFFTLRELKEHVLAHSGLQVLGIYFADVNADLPARVRFKTRFPGDERMDDLEKWHLVEEGDPDLFGRMHWLFLVKPLVTSLAEEELPSAKRAKFE